jgi:AcrR family transcriptional regulator
MARKASEERRAAIIDAAAQALARDGITETTTRKIAAAAGVNQAMIGYYFGGKDELLYAVLQEMMRRTAEIANASLPNGVGFAEALMLAMEAFWRHVEEAPELQVMQRPQSAWLARSQYEGYCAIVARLIAEASVAPGESLAETPEALARFLVGGLDGMILQFISDQNGQRARDDLRRLIAATLALARGASIAPGAASGAC